MTELLTARAEQLSQASAWVREAMADAEMVHPSDAAAIVREFELVIEDLRGVLPGLAGAVLRSHSAPAGVVAETGRWFEWSSGFLHFAQNALGRAQTAIGKRGIAAAPDSDD